MDLNTVMEDIMLDMEVTDMVTSLDMVEVTVDSVEASVVALEASEEDTMDKF